MVNSNRILRLLCVKNEEKFIVCENAYVANTFLSRLKGLMFKDDLQDNEGMLISPCSSIHTFFMKFAIDAIFLDKEFNVIKIYSNLKPWRMTSLVFGAYQVLEIKSHTLKHALKVGDKIEVLCTN